MALRLLAWLDTVELEAFLIQVIALLDLEEQTQLAVREPVVGQHEGLLYRQKVRFDRKRVGLQGAG